MYSIEDIIFKGFLKKTEFTDKFVDTLEKYVSNLINSGEYYKTEETILLLNNILGEKNEEIFDNNFIFSFPKKEICVISYIRNEDELKIAEYFYEDILDKISHYIRLYEYIPLLGRKMDKEYNIKHIIIKKNIHLSNNNYYHVIDIDDKIPYIETIFNMLKLENKNDKKIKQINALRSILTQSINNSNEVNNLGESKLEKIKNAIRNYDKDQLNFIHLNKEKDGIERIQGIAGSGKTFLLLHKLIREYIQNDTARIIMTCHNKSLVGELKEHITSLANSLKINKQIEWGSRLNVAHAWLVYSNICNELKIKYHNFEKQYTDPLKTSCSLTLKELKELKIKPIYDIIFIDEAQDLPNEWIELCSLISHRLYVAFDIFQNIFDNRDFSNQTQCDYTLTKCYRTPPLLLMFGHSIAMGLFEDKKLQWFSEAVSWQNIGYDISGDPQKDSTELILKRSPLSRFEDEEIENCLYFYDFSKAENIDNLIQIIEDIKKRNNLDNNLHEIIIIDVRNNYNKSQLLATKLENYGIEINNIIDSKVRYYNNKIHFGNINNVKGLEFGFVIIIGISLHNSIIYRNSLYMSITRSMLEAHLIFTKNEDYVFLKNNYNYILNNKCIKTKVPTKEERISISKAIEAINDKLTPEKYIMSKLEEFGYKYDKKVFVDMVLNFFDDIEDITPEKLDTKIKALILMHDKN